MRRYYTSKLLTLLFSSFLVNLFAFLTVFPPQSFAAFTYPISDPQRQTDCTNQGYSCFVDKYGFGSSPTPTKFSQADIDKMAQIKPYAIRAAQIYNSISGHDKVEPQMIVWWPILDTGGHIYYSNCANESGHSYYSWITNCDRADFWQLGWGAQFNHVKDLLEGFPLLYGSNDDTTIPQQIGQWIINYDKGRSTSPSCGGYSCTFPSMSMNQIFSGVDTNDCNGSPCHNPMSSPLPIDNWWASVLLRDPQLNAYNMADILIVDIINQQSVKGWNGSYNMTSGNMPNYLAGILNIWNTIPCTGVSGSGVGNIPGCNGGSGGGGGGTGTQYVSIATTQTAVGNAVLSGVLADYAEKFVKEIETPPSSCLSTGVSNSYSTQGSHYGYISSGDVNSCNPQDVPNNAWADYVKPSTDKNTYFQCVAFVAMVAEATNNKFSYFGDAFLLSQNVPDKYRWIKFNSSNSTNQSDPDYPRRGDIPIWSNGGSGPGHIAIFLDTPQPGRHMHIAEANWGSHPGIVINDNDIYTFDQTPQYGLTLEGWLRLK